MTSKRSDALRARARLAVAGILIALLASCAALPDDSPVVEELDDETGVTVARLGRPLELYQETMRREAGTRFAFVGPFETNNMGKRESFLWVALPVETSGDALPNVSIDGAAIPAAEAGRDAQFAGLPESPYRNPTPWISEYYFRLDQGTLGALGKARELTVSVVENTRNGPADALFKAQVADEPRLREYVARYHVP